MNDIMLNSFDLKYQNGIILEKNLIMPNICDLCNEKLTEPVILPCLHIFDKDCLTSTGNILRDLNQFKCPKCHFITCLSNFKLLNKNLFFNSIDDVEKNEEVLYADNKCILCTTGEVGVYKCPDCAGVICERCRNLHKEVVIFQSHSNIQELTNNEKGKIRDVVKFLADNKPVQCHMHKDVNLDSLCIKCCVALCSKCAINDHKSHEIVPLTDLFDCVNDEIKDISVKCKLSQEKINEAVEKLNNSLLDVTSSRDTNKKQIEDIADMWKSTIDKIKEEFITNNKTLHDNLEYQIMSQIEDGQKSINHIEDALTWVECYLKKCSILEASALIKPTVECLSMLSRLKIDPNQCSTSVPIRLMEADMIQNCVRNNFGTFQSMNSYSSHPDDYQDNNVFSSTQYRSPDNGLIHMISSDPSDGMGMYSPMNVNYEDQEFLANKESSLFHSKMNHLSKSSNGRIVSNQSFTGLDNMKHPTNLALSLLQQSNDFFSYSNDLSPHMTSKGSITTSTDSGQFITNSLYDDNALTSPIMPIIGSEFQMDGPIGSISNNFINGNFRPMMNINPIPKPPFPNRNRSYVPMVIKERWGSQGANRGQLNSPHGFCLGFNEEIIVADTQNHRIQIFSKDGQFISQFGIAGREEGHLWHPRKVTIIRNTQHYVVCDRGSERSRMQIFAKNGYFIRKIAIPYIDIVAGLAINSMGHIVAVDSVSPTIFVVTELGEMVKWIECSSQMREPSDIVVHGENYYICDFKGHCVCVYKQDGTFLFRFGNEKVTNYPNGIDVSNHGDVLVGDSHGNRFHVAVFTKEGHLTGEFECPSVKVSRACGLKITSEGYLVTLAKNNHNVLVIDTLYVT